MLRDFDLAPEIHERLGDGPVLDLLLYLWPADCQTCGRPLGERAPAICVDVIGQRGAVATLHHPGCRASRWADPPGYNMESQITYLAICARIPRQHLVGVPVGFRGNDDPIPVMVVNPSLEQCFLGRSNDGSWSTVHNMHRHLGARVPGEVEVGRPIAAGEVAVDDHIRVRIGSDRWAAPSGPDSAAAVRTFGGILLLITSAYGPGPRGVEHALADPSYAEGRYETAWLALSA